MVDVRNSTEQGHSVSVLLERLKQDDPDAADQLWQRFFAQLLSLAGARLRTINDRSVDEEDVLVSVFDRFFRAVAEQRFARLNDRDDLWQILLMLVDHRVTEHYRRQYAQKRGGGQVQSLDEIQELGGGHPREIADQTPGPQYIAAFNERLAQALNNLDPGPLREIAILKLEGYENKEIATRLQLSLSSVERKLRVIREAWHGEFGDDKIIS